MKKVLFVSWHGLGDSVLLTPVIKKYKELNQDSHITLLGMKRFGKSLVDLMSGLNFIDEVKTILPDAWNDFNSYKEGVEYICNLVEELEYDEKYILYCLSKDVNSFKHHKIFRFADDVEIVFNDIVELKTELRIKEEYIHKAEEFKSKFNKPIVILHNKAGNSPKEFSKAEIEELIKNIDGDYVLVEFGKDSTGKSIVVQEDDMEFTKALVYISDLVVAIDSLIMHIAGAFNKQIISMFKTTPVHQAMPIICNKFTVSGYDNEITQINKASSYKNDIRNYFEKIGYEDSELKDSMTYKNTFTRGNYGGRWNLNFDIKNGDMVLDIGGGDRPYPLATDVIDLEDSNEQRYGRVLDVSKNMHIGKAEDVLPKFNDNEFDFIYSSHTIEHIEDLPKALNEISRVGKRGFIIAPHYYLDYFDNNKSTGHKWFIGYDHSRNVLKIRRRRDYEFKDCKESLLDISSSELQSHNTDTNYRALWEVRFYWEDKINWEIDESLFEESKFINEKYTINENNITTVNKKLRLPDNYYHPMCYWAHMVTFRCTGGCPFCIVDGRGRHAKFDELSGKEILNWWNNLEHNNGQRLSLIGGETTLHKDIVEIVNNLEGYNVTVTTNCLGDFYNDKNFYKKFKPKGNLRINTSFHPHAISPEDYIRIIRTFRLNGYHVDQIAYVNTPEVWRYKDKIEKVRMAFPGELKSPPFLGFYNEEDKFNSPFYLDKLWPNESYTDQEGARVLCGIDDYNRYIEVCGSSKKNEVECPHGILSLIIGPNGNYYSCHYKLYYDIDPICNIKNFKPVDFDRLNCRHYGYCNFCDYPRLNFGKDNIRTNNNTKWLEKKDIVFGRNESERPELVYELNKILDFYNKNNIELDKNKCTAYLSAILYSGHKHRCNTLVVGDDNFAKYLKHKGYKIHTEYSEGDEFEFVIVFNEENNPTKKHLPFLMTKRGCHNLVFDGYNIIINIKE